MAKDLQRLRFPYDMPGIRVDLIDQFRVSLVKPVISQEAVRAESTCHCESQLQGTGYVGWSEPQSPSGLLLFSITYLHLQVLQACRQRFGERLAFYGHVSRQSRDVSCVRHDNS